MKMVLIAAAAAAGLALSGAAYAAQGDHADPGASMSAAPQTDKPSPAGATQINPNQASVKPGANGGATKPHADDSAAPSNGH